MRGGIVDRARRLGRHLVTHPALDRQRALAHLRKHRRGRQDLGGEPGEAKALERGVGHDNRPRGRHFAKTRGDVAPQLHKTQVGPHPRQLCPPSRSAGGNVRSRTEIGERSPHERVPRIGSLGHGDDRELAGAATGGEVLRGMNGKVRVAIDQRLLDFDREGALATDRSDRTVLVQVAGRLDDDELDRDRGGGGTRSGRGERVGHEPGLSKRERAATRRDPERQHFAAYRSNRLRKASASRSPRVSRQRP